jgi:hypothetical protein
MGSVTVRNVSTHGSRESFVIPVKVMDNGCVHAPHPSQLSERKAHRFRCFLILLLQTLSPLRARRLTFSFWTLTATLAYLFAEQSEAEQRLEEVAQPACGATVM